jgi:hypothetical protein
LSRTHYRHALLLCALLSASAAGGAFAAPTLLADSTTVERWTLPNGLEITTRNVPGAPAVAITWGYRFGLDDNMADRPALASLLAEVAFTARAGEVLERTREEMDGLRPEGWGVKVNRRHTLFSETARAAQFAGVLHQVAARMRGVTVTDSCLRRARATVRRLLGEGYLGTPDQMLQWQVREYARGADQAAIFALAAAQGVDQETAKSMRERIARLYAPANGVLALAGDFSNLDVRAIVASEFGGLKPGVRLPQAPAPPLDSATVVLGRPEVHDPLGVVGILAPALTDSLHPYFYFATLLLGAQAKETWGQPGGALGTRFQYALLDDPALVRFYPPPPRGDAARPEALSAALGGLVDKLRDLTIPRDLREAFHRGVDWLIGGPMSSTLAEDVRGDPAALALLSDAMASQALWGDEAFWTDYRRRFSDAVLRDPLLWGPWMKDPAHQVRLFLVPSN